MATSLNAGRFLSVVRNAGKTGAGKRNGGTTPLDAFAVETIAKQ